jgi:hypothetical protein
MLFPGSMPPKEEKKDEPAIVPTINPVAFARELCKSTGHVKAIWSINPLVAKQYTPAESLAMLFGAVMVLLELERDGRVWQSRTWTDESAEEVGITLKPIGADDRSIEVVIRSKHLYQKST